MATIIDKDTYLNNLEGIALCLPTAKQMGQWVAKEKFTKLYLLACGAANKEFSVTKYWFDLYSKNIEVNLFYPAEFIAQNPPRLDKGSVAFLASHSGTTLETVAAAEFLKGKSIPILAISKSETSPLASLANQTLVYGESDQSASIMLFLFLAFMSAYLKETDNWPLYDQLIDSLSILPEILFNTVEANDARVSEIARLLKDDKVIPVIASGPNYSTAYILGTCILTEALQLHGYPIEAAEFFHGPLEVVNPEQSFLLLLGEDPSRSISERVQNFITRYSERLFVFDARDYELKDIPQKIRPLIMPAVHMAVLRRLAEHISVWHNRPLTSRQYYRKVGY